MKPGGCGCCDWHRRCVWTVVADAAPTSGCYATPPRRWRCGLSGPASAGPRALLPAPPPAAPGGLPPTWRGWVHAHYQHPKHASAQIMIDVQAIDGAKTAEGRAPNGARPQRRSCAVTRCRAAARSFAAARSACRWVQLHSAISRVSFVLEFSAPSSRPPGSQPPVPSPTRAAARAPPAATPAPTPSPTP